MIKTKVRFHQHLLFFLSVVFVSTGNNSQTNFAVDETKKFSVETNFSLILFKPSET